MDRVYLVTDCGEVVGIYATEASARKRYVELIADIEERFHDQIRFYPQEVLP